MLNSSDTYNAISNYQILKIKTTVAFGSFAVGVVVVVVVVVEVVVVVVVEVVEVDVVVDVVVSVAPSTDAVSTEYC